MPALRSDLHGYGTSGFSGIDRALVAGEQKHLVTRCARLLEESECLFSSLVIKVNEGIVAQQRKPNVASFGIVLSDSNPEGKVEKTPGRRGQLGCGHVSGSALPHDEGGLALIVGQESDLGPEIVGRAGKLAGTLHNSRLVFPNVSIAGVAQEVMGKRGGGGVACPLLQPLLKRANLES